MERNFCLGCTDDATPPCIVSQKPINHNLDNILSGTITDSCVELFSCPVDSQEFVNGKLIITEKCIDCGICINRCIYVDQKPIYVKMKDEKKLLASLPHVRLYLETFTNGFRFYDEVATEGHSRSKRIDVLGINNKELLLIKILTDNNKIDFYRRSYENIIDKYREKIIDYKISIVFLVTASSANRISRELQGNNTRVTDIESLIEEMRGE